ncbi:hypothetical protein [Desulfovibrio sp. 86]|uniref:Uncharacterized protein n=1 Tax=uncultured Desulfovibrio sp. TaxID=167968 RepID=A0A212L917_9BACT|nr:hypothetical protein [Desulfovibrio sp. 86]SCM74005.1 conserved membrane hypothetical protein [uncultured Desulfovibrio sp.]VZH34579.1 conserved membrane protein of unknown function [Desulfovibrio sp. 86]
MIVERIEYVVNTTTRFVVDFWVRHWPLLLLILCAVLDFLGADDIISRLVFAASFVGTVACLKAFHLERCFWIYGLAFMGLPFVAFDPVNIHEIQKYLHLEALDYNIIWRITEAVQWTGVIIALSVGLYFLRFRHRVSPLVLIKIPLTTFVMYLFLQPFFMLTWFILIMQVYGILGIPE